MAPFSRLALALGGVTIAGVALARMAATGVHAQSEYQVSALVVHGPYDVSAHRIAHLPLDNLGLGEPEDADVPSEEVAGEATIDPDAPISTAPPKPTSAPFDVPGLEQFDAQIAASNGYLIIATGHNMRFYGKDGHPLESKEPGGGTLGVMTTTQLFDDEQMQADIATSLNLPRRYAALDSPTYIDLRVKFDQYRKRFWIISELNNKQDYSAVIKNGDRFAYYARRNRMVAAVSRTQDPRDGFYLYWWEGSVDDGACDDIPDGTGPFTCPFSAFQPGDAADFPALGFSPLYAVQSIHVNNTWPRVKDTEASAVARYALVNLLAADRMADGLSSWGWSYWNLKDRFGATVTGTPSPASGHGDPGDGTYFVQARRGDADSQGRNLYYHYWIVSSGSPPALARAVVPMKSAIGGGVGPQPNMPDLIPLGSSYFTAFRNGGIYSTWTERLPLLSPDFDGTQQPWTRIRFIRVNPFTAQVEIDKTIQLLDSQQKAVPASRGFPEIDVNESGNVVVAYIATARTHFAGVHYSVYDAETDTLTASRVLRDGDGLIPRLNADGAAKNDVDHGGVAVDPYDDTAIWIAHFFAKSTGSWGVAVGRVFGETRSDLYTKRLVLEPDLIEPGRTVALDFEVRNQGDGHTLPCRATIHLSTDDEISSDDLVIDEVEVPAIGSGDSKTVHRMLQLPSNLPEGGYYVGVLLDRGDRLPEYLEDNNASINNPRLLVTRPHRD